MKILFLTVTEQLEHLYIEFIWADKWRELQD